MPSPPPPYSPGQNHNISQAMSPSPHLSASAFTPPQNPPSAPPSEYQLSAGSSRPTSGFLSRPGSMVVPQSATSVTSNVQFPPPPPRNPGERSASRDKSHSKFSLSAFRNRNSGERIGEVSNPSAIESLRINTSDAISRAPASPGLPPTSRASQA